MLCTLLESAGSRLAAFELDRWVDDLGVPRCIDYSCEFTDHEVALMASLKHSQNIPESCFVSAVFWSRIGVRARCVSSQAVVC